MAASAHPDWYRKLVADPQVSVELNTDANIVERFDATQRIGPRFPGGL